MFFVIFHFKNDKLIIHYVHAKFSNILILLPNFALLYFYFIYLYEVLTVVVFDFILTFCSYFIYFCTFILIEFRFFSIWFYS